MSIALREMMRPLLTGAFADPFFTRAMTGFGPSMAAMGAGPRQRLPTFNVRETDNEIIMEAETPGFKRENLSVAIDDDRITISGIEQQGKEPVGDDDMGSFERRSFTQAFQLPMTLKETDVKATYQDGVLRVVLPKPEPVEPKKIAIGEGHPDQLEAGRPATINVEGRDTTGPQS